MIYWLWQHSRLFRRIVHKLNFWRIRLFGVSAEARAWADGAVAELEAMPPEIRNRPGRSWRDFKAEVERRRTDSERH